MLDKNKQELDRIMTIYQKDLEAMQTQKEEEKQARKKFCDDFEQLKHQSIWPIVVDIGNELTQYGHDFHVSEGEEYTDGTATFHPASITFNIYPANLDNYYKRPESSPYVSFVADTYAKKIRIMVSTMMPGEGGVIGTHGTYTIDKITPEFVEREIVEVLKHIPISGKTIVKK